MNKIVPCFLLALLLLSACNPEITLDATDFQRKLVVYGYFTPSKVMEVKVSHTSFPTDKETERKVDDALVLVLENGIMMDTLAPIGDGKYRSATNKFPLAGNAYQLEIHHPDYPTLITAADVVPIAPVAVVTYTFGVEAGTSAHYNIDVAAKMNTNQQYLGFHFDESGNIKETNNPCSVDNLFYGSFHLEEILFNDYTCIETHSDEIFLRYNLYSINGNVPNSVELSLCYVTPMAAEYHLKLEEAYLYTDEQSLDIFIEPVYLPQVVENGYGFFGTYNCTEFTLEL